ncbi:MAG: hypothetical protein IJP48_00870 [Synergistaceae bacterium]|nr:hypothetical protein [Synergistaceae bacterium]
MAAGIGSGNGRRNYNCVNSISITGGTVNAQGGQGGAAGIGGGYQGNSGLILIDNTQAIGRGQNGLLGGSNDMVIYSEFERDLRPDVPDKPQINYQSTVYIPEVETYSVQVQTFIDTTRTRRVTPPPSLENELENVTLNQSNGVESLRANGLPAGTYTVKTAESYNNVQANLTASYGFASSPDNFLSIDAGDNAGLSSLINNANILFEVTDVDGSNGLVTLRATANILNPDGTQTRHIVRENLTLREGDSTALSGLNLMGEGVDFEIENASPAARINLSSGAAQNFSVGNKFVYNLTANVISEFPRTIEISGTQNPEWTLNWGSDVTREPVRYGIDSLSVTNSELTFSNFYLNESDGTVYEGDIVLTTNDNAFQDGSILAEFDALRDNPVTTSYYTSADESTRLSEISGFYNSDGVFMLANPQTLTITQGSGQSASITIYSGDTIGDIREKLNDAIANGLGQARYTDSNNNFVSFVTDAQNQGLESVAGTFVIRSAIPGRTGELSFSGDEDLLNALGLNTIQASSESTYTANVYEAHSGKPIALNVKSYDNEFPSLIPPEIDIRVDAIAGLKST